MSYMSKKAHKRQTTIVTLSDQNQQEIRMINEQKELMLQEYEDKKIGSFFPLSSPPSYSKAGYKLRQGLCLSHTPKATSIEVCAIVFIMYIVRLIGTI